jgi:hypothetical protein
LTSGCDVVTESVLKRFLLPKVEIMEDVDDEEEYIDEDDEIDSDDESDEDIGLPIDHVATVGDTKEELQQQQKGMVAVEVSGDHVFLICEPERKNFVKISVNSKTYDGNVLLQQLYKNLKIYLDFAAAFFISKELEHSLLIYSCTSVQFTKFGLIVIKKFCRALGETSFSLQCNNIQFAKQS